MFVFMFVVFACIIVYDAYNVFTYIVPPQDRIYIMFAPSSGTYRVLRVSKYYVNKKKKKKKIRILFFSFISTKFVFGFSLETTKT